MKNIATIKEELKVIENRNFYGLHEKSCIECIENFQNRIKGFSIWRQLNDYDDFFAMTTLTASFLEENIKEKEKNPVNWYKWICNQNIDIQYLIILYLVDDISSILDFFKFLVTGKCETNVISVILTRKYIHVVTRRKEYPIKFDGSLKKEILDLINNLSSDNIFFPVFFALLSNIWVYNKYTLYYEDIRYAFIDKLMESSESKCIEVINSTKWEKTKKSLYSRLIIFMSLNEKPLELRKLLWQEILDFISNEENMLLKIGDGSNDSALLLMIASFLADSDDCIDMIKTELNNRTYRSYGYLKYDVNYCLIKQQLYFYCVAAFVSQLLFSHNKQELAEKLYKYLLDSFNVYICYNIPSGYDNPHSFSDISSAISAIWLNMVFFNIPDEKIIESFSLINNLDNKLLAAYTFFDKAKKHKISEEISPKIKSSVNSFIPIAENWFENEYASEKIYSWRQKLLNDVKEWVVI